MPTSQSPSRSHYLESIIRLSRSLFRLRPYRSLVCLVLILNFLIWPAPNLIGSARDISQFVRSLFRSSASAQRPETLADRIAALSAIEINPIKMVGYEGQIVSFSAIGKNIAGRTIQGLKFTWESSNTSKVVIDQAGRATFLQAGLARITCRAGSVEATAPVLVRPGPRRRQTDSQWRADQALLRENGSIVGYSDGSARDANLIASLLDKLVPTAYAQTSPYTGDDFLFDELWSEPRNLVGSPRNRVVEPTRIGAVLPEGSNFEFAVPIANLGSRGIAANLILFHNSHIWSRHGDAVTFDALTSWPSPGFSLGFGRIVFYGGESTGKYMLIDPDGTRHYLGTGSASANNTLQTNDGSHITFVGNATTGGTLYYNDGTRVAIFVVNNRLLPMQITDSNGNYIQIAYQTGATNPLALASVTDTLGRVIRFYYDQGSNLTKIELPGFGGTSQNPVNLYVHFDYQDRPLSYNFSGLTVENATAGQNIRQLRHIYFSEINTGYLFSHSDYGMIHNVSLRRQMSVDANGVISDGTESASAAFNYPTLGSTPLTDAPVFTQRTEAEPNSPTGIYNYSMVDNGSSIGFSITRPDSSILYLTRVKDASSIANGLMNYSEVLKAGQSYGWTYLGYANDPGGSPQVQSVTSNNDAGQQSLTTFDYDLHGNVTNKREYGHQISGQWQVRRRTRITYKTDAAYINEYLRNLVTQVEVLDALENTNDADDVVIARTAFTLDDYASMGGMENYGGGASPPGHHSSYDTTKTVRGNVTGRTVWTDIVANTSITRKAKYDIFGSVVTAELSCCNQKAFTLGPNTYWSNPESTTEGGSLTDTASYDFNTSAITRVTDADNQTVNYGYDAAMRPTQTTLPTGGTVSRSYDTAAMSATTTTRYNDSEGLKTITQTEYYDGWKRVKQTVNAANGQVNISYDAIGRIASRTNPFTQGGTPGPATTYQYDALGRATVVTLPGGNTIQSSYSGNAVTVTDQVNRKIKRESDGLGRLVKVVEQDSGGGLTQETTYGYSLVEKLTQVNQGGQMRSYKYDALGRLLFEKIPEQSATISDGAGGLWTTKYTYTDFNAVATRTDARGVVTTYSYDSLNRPTGISYNTSNAPGVAATANLVYSYGTGRQLKSVGKCDEYYEHYSYDQYDRVTKLDRFIQGRHYTSIYSYNQISQRTQTTDPALSLPVAYDSIGRLSQLGDAVSGIYLSGMSYNVAGQVTGLTLGNGVAESYGYDSQRLQMTTQSATKSGNTLMSLTYGYQASAGQNGAGTTAGNSGQLMTISGTINGSTENASYTYDLVGRLATSNQTTNSVTAQRRFSYDRWGNRTGVWDAVSGGTQIQSVTLAQSAGAPTNRIQSVTNSGSTVNYTYDGAGNVTNDGAHSYSYDAENRVVSVDGGATKNWYDHRNRRVVKEVAGVKTDYIWDGEKVVEVHDGNGAYAGATLARYVYSGGRMIAKVAGGVTRYFLNDRLSARAVLDVNGNVVGRQGHLPFGEEIAGSGEQEKHRFTTYERDSESNTDYAVNRQYSQSTGRFMRTDPYDGSSDITNPQSLNRYAYVQNDPINATDPLGLYQLCIFYRADVPGGLAWYCFNVYTDPPRRREPGRRGQGLGPRCNKQRADDLLKSYEEHLDYLEKVSRGVTDGVVSLATQLNDRAGLALGNYVKNLINRYVDNPQPDDFDKRQAIENAFADAGREVRQWLDSIPGTGDILSAIEQNLKNVQKAIGRTSNLKNAIEDCPLTFEQLQKLQQLANRHGLYERTIIPFLESAKHKGLTA